MRPRSDAFCLWIDNHGVAKPVCPGASCAKKRGRVDGAGVILGRGIEANGKQESFRSTGMGKNTSVFLMLRLCDKERERTKGFLVACF